MVKCLEVNLCSQPELKIVCPNILLSDGTTKRVDEIAKTDHYNQCKKDFDLVKEMGTEFLRYGPPDYKTHAGPEKQDCSFTDFIFNRL